MNQYDNTQNTIINDKINEQQKKRRDTVTNHKSAKQKQSHATQNTKTERRNLNTKKTANIQSNHPKSNTVK